MIGFMHKIRKGGGIFDGFIAQRATNSQTQLNTGNKRAVHIGKIKFQQYPQNQSNLSPIPPIAKSDNQKTDVKSKLNELNNKLMRLIDLVKIDITDWLFDPSVTYMNRHTLEQKIIARFDTICKLHTTLRKYRIDNPAVMKLAEYVFNSVEDNKINKMAFVLKRCINHSRGSGKTTKKIGVKKLSTKKLGTKKIGTKKLGTKKLSSKKVLRYAS